VKRVGKGGLSGASAAAFFHHRDHLASIGLVTNAAGADVRRVTCRAFGEQAVVTGAHAEPKGFIGEGHDAETYRIIGEPLCDALGLVSACEAVKV
jgi:hypothetical protein